MRKMQDKGLRLLQALFSNDRVDEFDDFELMILVHEVLYDKTKDKVNTTVRVTASAYVVETDSSSNGIFQQPLNITVEQGTESMVVELLERGANVVASLTLNVAGEILESSSNEKVFPMKVKGKGIRNPRIKLTMAAEQEGDPEQGMLKGVSSDVSNFVRLHVGGEKGGQGDAADRSELEVLLQACTGPLEVFEGLGNTRNVYVGIIGPPLSKKYAFGMWSDKHAFEAKKPPSLSIELLRVESVQTDPTRIHVFVINYFDTERVFKSMTLRRIDRARDVWVEILRLTVQKVHDWHQEKKKLRQTQIAASTQGYDPYGPSYGTQTWSPSAFAGSQASGRAQVTHYGGAGAAMRGSQWHGGA